MANSRYSDLLNDVLPSLAADPSDPVTEHAIKRAVIEFCAATDIWQVVQDPVDVEAGELQYSLDVPAGAVVEKIDNVTVLGQPIINKSVKWLNSELSSWQTVSGRPRYFTQIDTESLLLAPLPSETIANGLAFTLVLKPSQASTGFPRWIHEQYIYDLADGALALLMAMPDKPWSNKNEGESRRASFMNAIGNARNRSVSGLSAAAVRTKSQH